MELMKTLTLAKRPSRPLSRLAKWPVLSTLALCSLMVLGTARAATINVAGVKIDDSASVAGSALVLNGAGVRYKGPFRVYTAALYTGKKTSTPESVHASAGPKRIALTMLREIDAGELGNLFMRSMENNTPRSDLLKILPSLSRMGSIFAEQKRLAAGESIQMDWVPGTGMVLNIKGKTLEQAFKEPEFFQAMLDIWIGKNPADWMLKDALLGNAR